MTVSNNTKLKAKLGKANELEFLLSIKGTSSDPMAIQPEVRFHLKEQSGGFGLIFPMERIGGEKVKVSIPGDLPYFNEGRVYTGIVEVNLGNRLFMPTTVDIIFEKELEVVALPILVKEEEEPQEEEKVELEEVFAHGEKPRALSLLDVAFPEQKKKAASKATPPPAAPPKKAPLTKEQQLREKFKAKFKSLLID